MLAHTGEGSLKPRAENRLAPCLRALGGVEALIGKRRELRLVTVSTTSAENGETSLMAQVVANGWMQTITGEGNGPVSAFVDAISTLDHRVRVLDYTEHALSAGGDALAAAYVECEVGEGENSVVVWGVGMDANIVNASLKAVISAINRVT